MTREEDLIRIAKKLDKMVSRNNTVRWYLFWPTLPRAVDFFFESSHVYFILVASWNAIRRAFCLLLVDAHFKIRSSNQQ